MSILWYTILMKEVFNTHSADQIQKLLNQLRRVGQEKLLGYLPLSTITDICHEDPKALQREAEGKGLKTLLLKYEECHIASGALYIYDPEKLQAFLLLPENKSILERNDWPTQVADFVVQVAQVVAEDRPLFDLIALAFNDPRPEYQPYARPTQRSPRPWRFS